MLKRLCKIFMSFNGALAVLTFALPWQMDTVYLASVNNNFPYKSTHTVSKNKKVITEEDPGRLSSPREKLPEDYLCPGKNKKINPSPSTKKEYSFPAIKSLCAEIEQIDISSSVDNSLFFASFDNEPDECGQITPRQIQEKKLKAGFYIATATAELLDSVYLPYFSRGLFNVIGTAYKIKAYGDKMEKKYGVRFEVSGEEVVVIYEGKF